MLLTSRRAFAAAARKPASSAAAAGARGARAAAPPAPAAPSPAPSPAASPAAPAPAPAPAPEAQSRCVFVGLTPELVPSAIECVAETFGGGGAAEDPFSWLFNLRRHHWRSMAAPFIERAAEAVPLRPRLSVVALNERTRKVEGLMINEDWVTPRPQAYRSRLSSDWWPTRAAFAELHARFVDERPGAIERGTTMRVMYFSCVHPDARGLGIMRGLWRGTVSKARENGYTHVTAQAGSSAVRRILHEQLGFDEVASINYSSWEYAEPPISNAEAGGGGGGGGGGGDDEHADAVHGHGGRVSKVLAELALRNPAEYDRLSISIRRVPSNLYV